MTVLTGPPEIDGYEFLEPIGSGGFADVHLYEQELPRRTVAVKVLRGDLGEQAVAAFLDEANVMAQLSAHPSIVTVHQAGVLPDHQRPYIVMEHCPYGNLGTRYRTETFSVAEALAIGIQIAGAIETAHRAGVLHRDIKPENVLTTSLGRPALTDFGIASRLGAAASGEASGMSVPWSAPEAIDGSWSGPASDVYSLGATVYSLLAGRSPFEAPAGPNGVLDYAWRILHDDLRPIARADVPESLEGVLATAMARSPQARYTSALSFARALQKVEREVGLEVTNIDVLDNGFSPPDAPEGGGLSLHPVAPIDQSLHAVSAGPPTMSAGPPTLSGGGPTALSLSMAAAAEAGAGSEPGEVPVDITLLMSPSALAPPTPDAVSPGAEASPASDGAAPNAEASPGIDAPSPDAHLSPGLDPPSSSAVVSSGLDRPSPNPDPMAGMDELSGDAVVSLAFDLPAPKRGVWPAVLVDFTLVSAVAGAAVVYLLLLRQG